LSAPADDRIVHGKQPTGIQVREVGVAQGRRRTGSVRLAAFDLDGTLLRGDTVCVALARRLGRLAEMEAFERLTDQDAIGAARAEMARWYAACAGGEVRSYLDDLRLAPGAQEAFATLRRHGVATAIVSITWDFAVAHVAALLGADHFVGTRIDGGEIVHFWPEDKARWLLGLAADRGVAMDQVAAVGDSWGDVPMLRAVGRPYFVGASVPPGLGHAVHVPDGDVRRIAERILAPPPAAADAGH
jgi:HAD superfamily phosphoserine phosphatase-like hydrolase